MLNGFLHVTVRALNSYDFYIERAGGIDMIDFEEELKKFQPSLEVEEAEDAIYDRDLTDMTDILLEMMKERNN
jgi:hypothetical protein